MSQTVRDQQASQFAPEADDGHRVPRLPEPPRFDDPGAGEAARVHGSEEMTAEPATHPDRWAGTAVQPGEFTETHDEPASERTAVLLQQPADESIYRGGSTAADLSAEQRKLAAERAARREARQQALAAPDVRTQVAAEPVVVTRRSTDRFAGSLGLFLLRLVVAAIMAVYGLGVVTNPAPTEAILAQTVLPEPRIVAMVAGFGALAIAVALVFGLLTRVAGLGIVLIAGGALTFVLWGNWSPFVAGQPGFLGDLELLLAAVGLLFLCVGAGGFSLDRSFRKSREKDRLAEPAL